MSPPAVVLHTRVVTETGGGPDKTILNSPRFLKDPRYRLMCAFMYPPSDRGIEQLRRRAELWNAPFFGIPDRGPLDLRVLRLHLDLCRRENVAIWHAHDYKSNFLGLLLRPFWPMRLVTTVHGWVKFVPPRTTIYYALDRNIVRYYERVICVSRDLRQECLRYGVRREQCHLIENAIDTATYRRSNPTAVAKQKLGLPPDRPLVGAVGRLSKEKGFDVLIRAVHRLLQGGTDVSLALVGEGEDRRPLEHLVAELGCGERVRLMGYQGDTIPYYEAMDVYALSSHREGLPNALLEAMALEVPIVATRLPGFSHLVRDQENGLLVKIGDDRELARALGRLLADQDLRRRFARAGREVVETGYSFDVRMRRVKAIYDGLLGHK